MNTTSDQSAAYIHLREEQHFSEPDAKEFLDFLDRHNLFDPWFEWMRSEGFKIGDVESESKATSPNELSIELDGKSLAEEPAARWYSIDDLHNDLLLRLRKYNEKEWNHELEERRNKQKLTENENKVSSDTVLGFTAILVILLIVLKLTGALNWSWAWVLFPIWIWPALPVALFLFCIVSKIWSGLSK